MSIVRAARDDRPASHLPSPAVAVPQPRRPEPASSSLAAPSRAARTASAGASAAPSPARPATPSRHHVRAVLTGSPRSPRSAPRLRIVRPSDRSSPQPGPPCSPAQPRSGPRGRAGPHGQPRPPQPASMRPGSPTAVRPCSAPPTGLRLTRRGRLVLSVFALALILGLITILWATLAGGAQAASGRTHTGSVYQGLRRVTVLPGQTLWSIAQQRRAVRRPADRDPADHADQRDQQHQPPAGPATMGPARLIPAPSPSPPLPSAGPAPAAPGLSRTQPQPAWLAPIRVTPLVAPPGGLLRRRRPALAGQHAPFPYASGDPVSGTPLAAALPARELCLPRRDTPPELASGPALDHNI